MTVQQTPNDSIDDCYMVARRDLIGDREVHTRFHGIRAGTQICLIRTGKTTFFCGFFDNKGTWVQYKDIPQVHYLRLVNRVFPLSGMPKRDIVEKMAKLKIVRFNAIKVAKLSAYTKRSTFPDTLGTVRTKDGKTYESCVIVGDPELNTRGLLYLMLDGSIVFVPEI